MPAITKDTIIGDVLRIQPAAARILMEIGMHCLGCPASVGEIWWRLARFTAWMPMRF